MSGWSNEASEHSRTCINCGKVVAPDRKQRCNHCGEWFYDPSDPSGTYAAPDAVEAVTVTSRRGVAVGIFIALVVPAACWVLAELVQFGIAPYDQAHAVKGTIYGISETELLLGPLGIGIAGWSAGVRSTFGWLAVFAVGAPVLALVWFLCVATLSGTLGDPF